MTRHPCTVLATVLTTGLLSGIAVAADVIYETADPFGGPFGVWGFDVSDEQSVAVRFTAEADYTLNSVGVWLWNNDLSGGEPEITITVRPDAELSCGGCASTGGSRPTDEVLESWSFTIPYTGFGEPRLFELSSADGPVLRAGARYWICAESDAPGGRDPVWAVAWPDLGFGSTGDPATGEWTPAVEASIGAVAVCGNRLGGSTNVLDVLAAWGEYAGCPEDADRDGFVGFDDLIAVLAAWGNKGGPEDIDESGTVDFDDLLIVIDSLGPCP